MRKVTINFRWARSSCFPFLHPHAIPIIGSNCFRQYKAVWFLKPAEPRQITSFYHELPENQQFNDLSEHAIAVSPDGKQFVYATNDGLYLRSIERIDASIIPGTGENPEKPFFSPDGKWVGYITSNQIRKITISGGVSELLTEAGTVGFIDWGTDNTIVFSEAGKGIMRISADGGKPEEIVRGEEREFIGAPQILPDGKSVLFTESGPESAFYISVQSLEFDERRRLFPGDTARYLPTGHIIYSVGNEIFSVQFDLDELEVIGSPVTVVKGVMRGAALQYAVSNSGTLAYIPGTTSDAGSLKTLVWVDHSGKEESVDRHQT